MIVLSKTDPPRESLKKTGVSDMGLHQAQNEYSESFIKKVWDGLLKTWFVACLFVHFEKLN